MLPCGFGLFDYEFHDFESSPQPPRDAPSLRAKHVDMSMADGPAARRSSITRCETRPQAVTRTSAVPDHVRPSTRSAYVADGSSVSARACCEATLNVERVGLSDRPKPDTGLPLAPTGDRSFAKSE